MELPGTGTGIQVYL